MPVTSKGCPSGRYRIGSGACIYDSKEKAERAYRGYLWAKHASSHPREFEGDEEKDFNDYDSSGAFNEFKDEPKKKEEGIEIEIEKLDEPKGVTTGIKLIFPHGNLIFNGRKKAVVKSEFLEFMLDWNILTEHNKAYGYIKFGYPELIDRKKFEELEGEHKVSLEEKELWWEEDSQLYYYPIKSVVKFEVPRQILPIPKTKSYVHRVIFIKPSDGRTQLDELRCPKHGRILTRVPKDGFAEVKCKCGEMHYYYFGTSFTVENGDRAVIYNGRRR